MTELDRLASDLEDTGDLLAELPAGNGKAGILDQSTLFANKAARENIAHG